MSNQSGSNLVSNKLNNTIFNTKPSVIPPQQRMRPNVTVPQQQRMPNMVVPQQRMRNMAVPQRRMPNVTVPQRRMPNMTVPQQLMQQRGPLTSQAGLSNNTMTIFGYKFKKKNI